MTKLIYEQPTIKKYGNMKNLTFSAVGSGTDFQGGVGINTRDTDIGRITSNAEVIPTDTLTGDFLPDFVPDGGADG